MYTLSSISGVVISNQATVKTLPSPGYLKEKLFRQMEWQPAGILNRNANWPNYDLDISDWHLVTTGMVPDWPCIVEGINMHSKYKYQGWPYSSLCALESGTGVRASLACSVFTVLWS